MTAPVARVDDVRETRFGVELSDPYRWMEETDSAEFRSWMAGQGAHARTALGALPHRDELLARIAELGTTTSVSDVALAGNRVFYLRQDASADVPVLMVYDERTGTSRAVLDPTSIPSDPSDEHSSLDWYVPSPDGRLVACGVSQGGAENSALYVVDVDQETVRAQGISQTRHGYLSWLEDETFVYHRYRDVPDGTPAAERRIDSRSLIHQVDDDPESDVPVLARSLNRAVNLAPLDRPFVLAPHGSKWLIGLVSRSALGRANEPLSDCSLYVAPRSALADPATCSWTKVADATDGVSAFAVHDERLYLVSHRNAGRRRVLAVPLRDPDLSRADVVVPETDRVIENIAVVGDYLLVQDLDRGIGRLRRVPLAGGAPEEVRLPVEGSILELAPHPERPEALLLLTGWSELPAVHRYEERSGTVQQVELAPSTPPPTGTVDLVTKEVQVPARDGTPIPLSIVHRSGLALDGESPTVLAGYGSYGFSLWPTFDPESLAWYERGGIRASAHVRGGGELGHEWHQGGRLLNKENTITDFIDCAEYLVSEGYTRPGRLAGYGGSAGGIPTGGALVRRPDLWAAMLMLVPATNLTRMEFSENGPINVPEFGSVTTEDGLRALLIVDSYLRVVDGDDYPAVLLTTGMNDPRIAPWLPAKLAARLQAATASDRPILLRVDEHAGHGFGSTRGQRQAELADAMAFLLHAMDC